MFFSVPNRPIKSVNQIGQSNTDNRIAGLWLSARDGDRLWGPESRQLFRDNVLHLWGQGHGVGEGGELGLLAVYSVHAYRFVFVCSQTGRVSKW